MKLLSITILLILVGFSGCKDKPNGYAHVNVKALFNGDTIKVIDSSDTTFKFDEIVFYDSSHYPNEQISIFDKSGKEVYLQDRGARSEIHVYDSAKTIHILMEMYIQRLIADKILDTSRYKWSAYWEGQK